MNRESEVGTLDERKAAARLRWWRIVDVVVPVLSVVLSVAVFLLIGRHGLTVVTVALLVATAVLWVVAYFRLTDVGPGSRTEP